MQDHPAPAGLQWLLFPPGDECGIQELAVLLRIKLDTIFRTKRTHQSVTNNSSPEITPPPCWRLKRFGAGWSSFTQPLAQPSGPSSVARHWSVKGTAEVCLHVLPCPLQPAIPLPLIEWQSGGCLRHLPNLSQNLGILHPVSPLSGPTPAALQGCSACTLSLQT